MTDVVCDLDGVIYRGETEVPGAGAALTRLADAGVGITFVTNNSARTAEQVADKIGRVTGFHPEPASVVTSAMAAVSLLSQNDAPVFVVGETGIREALRSEGIDMTEDEAEARSVMVGVARHISYDLLAQASAAVRAGARFIATNSDPTFPAADGLLPGAGSIVAAVATASLTEPEFAGKPNAAISDLVNARVGDDVWVVGDRLDTDIALAESVAEWRSVLVLTGVSSESDTGPVPDHVVADFAAAVELALANRGG